MVHADRELIGARGYFGRSRVGARAVCALRFIGEGIFCKDWLDGRADGNGQRVARKRGGVNSLPLRRGGHGENLRCAEYLPEALILAEIKRAVTPIVNFRQNHRAANGEPKFIAHKRRNPRFVGHALVIEEISRVECGIAQKLKNAAVHFVASRARDHVGVARGAMTDFRRHHAGTGLHFLNGVDVEIGKRRAAHFRIGGVRSIHGKHSGGAALPVHRELLRKVRRAIRVGHGAGGQ